MLAVVLPLPTIQAVCLVALAVAIEHSASPPMCAAADRVDGVAWRNFIWGGDVAGNPPAFLVPVNAAVGATQFYDMGFAGGRAVVTNIEAGAIWGLHESLVGRVSQFIADPVIVATGTTQLGEFDVHATAVGQAIGGRGNLSYLQAGVAFDAELWSGSIATAWTPPAAPGDFSFGFEVSDASFFYPYVTAMRTGVVTASGTRRTDVVNSSWGYADPAGREPGTIVIDALAKENNVVVVMSAGNDGPAGNTVGGPASGYNGISVAATMTGTAPPYTPWYATVADFSSRGPGDFFNPVSGTTVPGVRATVDIAAPGDQLALAAYLGHTGGNITGTNAFVDATNFYFLGVAGTSFAAPIVAGGAALMVDAGRLFAPGLATGAEMLDARVIKAALMTSATAPADWNNGQQTVAGVITTTHALDPATGAGLLDLAAAYRVYVGEPASLQFGSTIYVFEGIGTTLGVSGSAGGTGLERRGWDLGSVRGQTSGTSGNLNTYTFGQPFTAGRDQFTATLTWFADRTLGETLDSALDEALADLTLQLIRTDAPDGDKLIAQSIARYGSSEFLRFTVPETGSYALRVLGLDPVYNATDAPLDTTYGLAWSVAVVPEPSTWVMLAGAALVPLWSRRRHHRASTAMPPRSAMGSGTTRTSMSAKCISVALTARELAHARYQPRNTCDGKWASSVIREKPTNVEQT